MFEFACHEISSRHENTVIKRVKTSIIYLELKSVVCIYIYIYIYIYIGCNAKFDVLKKTTLQLYFKNFIGKTNSGNLIM